MIPDEESLFESLCLRHGKERQEKFSRAKVVIFGLGGLGSHIAIMLARAGVGYLGHLHLIDFDKVELTNIHRQYYHLTDIGHYKTDALQGHVLEVNPYLSINTTRKRLVEEDFPALITGNTIVIEAFDRPELKASLVDAFFSQYTEGQCLFAASGMAGFGDGNSIQARRVNPNFYLVGDGVSDVAKEKTLCATRVSLCASAQAHCVLQYLEERPLPKLEF